MKIETTFAKESISYCSIVHAISHDELVRKTVADGSTFYYDSHDRLVLARYSSGSLFIRREDAVLLESEDGSHWFGVSEQPWLRLN